MRIYVTGICGLIGASVAELGLRLRHEVHGCDSDARGKWFGEAGSTRRVRSVLALAGAHVDKYDFRHAVDSAATFDLVVHCASQPSHDLSRFVTVEDSEVNYMGTVMLLQAMRALNPNGLFAFLSTNKVYGSRVNELTYKVVGSRFVPDSDLPGIDRDAGVSESCCVDRTTHTPFGVSKLAADLMVQEYSNCWGLRTVCFRCGCLTGIGGAAVEQQGFLGYLVKCAVQGKPYTVYGYDGYQVRDNIAASDVASAIFMWANDPVSGVYNLGGGATNSISVLEAIEYLRSKHGLVFETKVGPPRLGDHKWWITDTSLFEMAYPAWHREHSVWSLIDEMVERECCGRAAAC